MHSLWGVAVRQMLGKHTTSGRRRHPEAGGVREEKNERGVDATKTFTTFVRSRRSRAEGEGCKNAVVDSGAGFG